MQMARSSIIRKMPYFGNGSEGPDTTYVVDLYEDGLLKESRQLPNKSVHYANDVSENWDSGLIVLEESK